MKASKMGHTDESQEQRRNVTSLCIGQANLLCHECGRLLPALQNNGISIGIGTGDLTILKQDEVDLESQIDNLRLRGHSRPSAYSDAAPTRFDLIDNLLAHNPKLSE